MKTFPSQKKTLVAWAFLFLPPLNAAPAHIQKVWDLKTHFESCTWDANIEITDDGSVRLKKTVLLQDEEGATHWRNVETLGQTRLAKKIFEIADPRCDKAQMFVFGEPAEALANGKILTGRKPLPSTGWTLWDVSANFLRKGQNEFVFCNGGQLLIENSLYPNRSAKSADGGISWDFDHLGSGVENGEYLVRLRLAQYPRRGTLTSEVVDLVALARPSLPRPRLRSLRAFDLLKEEDRRAGCRVLLEARWGSISSEGYPTWSGWADIGSAFKNVKGAAPPRYLQWKAVLETASAVSTPRLQKLELRAEMELEPGNSQPESPGIRLIEASQPALLRRSFPFAHQQPLDRLQQLRTRWKLDEVVGAAGATEIEKFIRLRDWARRTAPKGWDAGAAVWCPPWDALLILETNRQPLALCMCTHFSTIFSQSALALGYNARHVILDHHCTAEVWSNQHRKWILMDAGNSTNPDLNCHYERNGVPLNALEIRQLWKKGRASEIDIVYTPPLGRLPGNRIGEKDQCGFENFRRFAIPFRNDHLATPFPGELEQGQSHYYCDLYLWWEDQASPVESPEYGKTSCRSSDFYWTLNETLIDLEETEDWDTLSVTLETDTPNFDRYLIQFNDGGWEARPVRFPWKLRPGRSSIRAKSINRFGVEGPASEIILEAGQ